MRLGSVGSRLPAWLRRPLRRSELMWRLRDRSLGTPRGDPTPGELRPVIHLPTWLGWEQMQQRPQALIKAFAAAGHPAYFVDPTIPQSRQDDGVHVVPNLDAVPGANAVLYIHFAPAARLLRLFDDPVVIYDILDDLAIYDPGESGLPPGRRVESHHTALVRGADVVTVSSAVLAERHRHERPDLVLVENGVDLGRFAHPGPRPTDLPAGSPIVGYHGAIASWFDAGMVGGMAAAHPEWAFVLVGPIDPGLGVADLRRHSNIHLLGARPPSEIPAYVASFDVGIVPFVVDRLTEAVSPLKVFEYLAAGVPVVSTPLPACRDVPAVRLAADADGFAAQIEAALGADETVAPVTEAAWSRRLLPLLERLDAGPGRRVPS